MSILNSLVPFRATTARWLALSLACFGLACSAGSAVAAAVDFEKDIKPIFVVHCLECHNADAEEGGFVIDRDTSLEFLISGDADESDLFEHITGKDDHELMPPEDYEKPLSDAQITLVKTWINEGANWPEGVKIEADEAVELVDGGEKPVVPVPDDDETAGITPQLLQNASGSLHPAATHLPIGLLLVAGLFALLSLRGNFVMSDCAYYCLWIGALGAIGACVTGWFYSPMEHKGSVAVLADLWDQTQPVFWHRAGALGASVLALLLALMAWSTRARDPDDGVMWKLGTIVLACVIGWVGHLGGELTYGKSHYDEVHQVIGAFVPGWNGEEEKPAVNGDDGVPAEPADKADAAASDEDEEESDALQLDAL